VRFKPRAAAVFGAGYTPVNSRGKARATSVRDYIHCSKDYKTLAFRSSAANWLLYSSPLYSDDKHLLLCRSPDELQALLISYLRLRILSGALNDRLGKNLLFFRFQINYDKSRIPANTYSNLLSCF